jgi:hypothetical protein
MPKEEWSFNNMNGHTSGFRRARSERGQAFLLIVVVVAILLLGVLGLCTDYAQIWAHRQMTQGAADAACQAAAADLFLKAVDPEAEATYGIDFSWIGSSFDCGSKPNSVPCKYASLNGYSGSHVSVSFPDSLPGVPPISSGFGAIAHPYVQVSITYPVSLSFTKLVSSSSTFNMSAKAGCGLNPVALPIPLLVLHHTASAAVSVGGTAAINILGGPNRSIQVNSNSATAVSVGTVNLSQAGPSGTGADFAVFGGPSTKPAGVNVGTTGHWVVPASPVGDPWVIVATPSVPSTAGTATPVPFTVNGCPDPVGCVEFTGGNYTSCISNNVPPDGNGCLISPRFTSGGNAWQAGHAYATGALIQPTNAQHNAGGYIYQAQNSGTSGGAAPNPWNQTIGGNQPDGSVTWKNMGPVSTNPNTAIFDPGLYYVGTGGLQPGSNTTIRMSTVTGDGTNGVTFYFSTSAGTLSVGSNTGKASACTSASPGSGSPNNCVVSYKPSGATVLGVTSRALQCPSGPANPSQVPATIDGNILLGPCSGTYGSADGKNRGFLFFQNRSTAANPSWGGGGQFLLSGFMYFHSGNGATCGTNTTCLTMNGGSGAGAFALGNVVVDELSMTGNSTLNMILNPAVTFQVLRPQLLR